MKAKERKTIKKAIEAAYRKGVLDALHCTVEYGTTLLISSQIIANEIYLNHHLDQLNKEPVGGHTPSK